MANAWFNRGMVALQLRNYADAVASLKRADVLQPKRVDTLTNLGVAYQEMDNGAEAIAAYQRAHEVKPDFLPAVNGFAEIYIRYFEKNPSSDEYLEGGLRWAEHSLGIKPYQLRLRELFERVLKIRPGNLPATNGLARVLAATPTVSPRYNDNRRQAATLCRNSLEIKPDQPDVAKLLAELGG